MLLYCPTDTEFNIPILEMKKLELWRERDPRAHNYPPNMGTLKPISSLSSILTQSSESPPHSWQTPPFTVTCANQAMGAGKLGHGMVGMEMYFSDLLPPPPPGSQLGLGPREAGIYVLPLIILADIFQTSPADTVLTRAEGRAFSPGDTCEQGQLPWRKAGFPWGAAGSGTGASRQAALWQSPYVSHTPL